MAVKIKRGDIVLVKLDPVVGSEQGKTRPALVIQNDVGNEYSPTTIVAPLTSRIFSKKFPTNVELEYGPLKKRATILMNQIRTVDKSRIIRNYGKIPGTKMKEINEAIMNSLGLE